MPVTYLYTLTSHLLFLHHDLTLCIYLYRRFLLLGPKITDSHLPAITSALSYLPYHLIYIITTTCLLTVVWYDMIASYAFYLEQCHPMIIQLLSRLTLVSDTTQTYVEYFIIMHRRPQHAYTTL